MDEFFARGPQNAVKLLKEEQNTGKGKRKLKNLLAIILDPGRVFDEDTAELCFSLLAGGKVPDEYFKILKTYDNSPVCGLVWNANFFAYRCRDCGISPCMSLCADCFSAGNHGGHDFNMFKSQAGGACDCGDETVMKKEGFCHLHGQNSQIERSVIPADLIDLPKRILPELVVCLYEKVKIHFDNEKNSERLSKCLQDVTELLKVLNRTAEVEALREIVCERILSQIESLTLSSPNAGTSSSEVTVGTSTEYATNMVSCEASNGRKIVRTASTETTTSIEMTVTNARIDGPLKPFVEDVDQGSQASVMKEGRKQTYLQFFMDVLVKTEFPSVLATFLLQLLPNPNYKETFTRLFCRQYTAIGKSLSSSTDPDVLSNHMVHVSVQLFSNETLALKMVKEENLLFKMIFVLSKMIGECLDNYSLEVEGHEVSIMAVNCSNKLLKSHCYWPIASDLTNILSHQSVAKIFLETGDCLNRWMHFVTMLTGMNMNNRRMMSYIEYEPKQYYTAFSMEFESVAAVMWEIHRSILKMNEKVHALKMIEVSAAALKDWYSFVPCRLKKCSFTFHLSLHRYFALFVSQAVNHFEEDVSRIIPMNIIWDTLEYLVNAIVSLQEIRAGIWLYNGHQMTCQAQSYLQSYFCNSMFDLDVFFLQITASLIDADTFIKILLERFSISHWFQFGEEDEESRSSDDLDKTILLVEGFLNTILMLLTHRVYSGSSEKDIQQKDIVANLCLADRTHSQLVDIIPTRPGDTHTPGKYFDEILASVADYKEPAVESSGLHQGIYTPKEHVWVEDFDFNHIHLRVYKKSDQQTALDRYNEAMKRLGYSMSTSTWPPLRDLKEINNAFKNLFRLLKSKMLHKLLIFILHKTVNDPNSVPEAVLIPTIHLLQLSVDYADKGVDPGLTKEASRDDVIIDLVLKYVDASEGLRESMLPELRTELAKDAEINAKVLKSPSLDITYVVEEKFHPLIFRSLCQYMDTVLDQDSITFSSTIQHIRNLVLLLSEKQQLLLKKLVQYWRNQCAELKIDIAQLPFVTKRVDCKSFRLVLSLLVKHFNYVFQIRSRPLSYPSHAFDLNLPNTSIRDNLTHQLFDDDMSKHGDLEHFIEITQCSRTAAIEFLKASHNDLQEALTKFLNTSNNSDQSEPPPDSPSFLLLDDQSCSSMENEPSCSSIVSVEPSFILSKIENEDSTSSSDVVDTMSTMSTHSDPCSSSFSFHQEATTQCNYSVFSMLCQLRSILLNHSNTSPSKVTKKEKIVAGDGAFYIERLLIKCFSMSENLASTLKKLCPELTPQECSSPGCETSTTLDAQDRAKKERRKKAAERQKQLLEEFASKQKKFMESAEAPTMDVCEDSNDPFTSQSKECVICGQFMESTEERPLGLIVYMHPSTVLGKRKVPQSDTPQTCSSTTSLKKGSQLLLSENVIKPRRLLLTQNFESRSVRASFECGIDCGINVQSCGHHVHVDCQQAYFKTLQEDHLGLINTDKGEFSCPLCRRLSNGVMPLIPTSINSSIFKELKEDMPLEQKCEEIASFLAHFQQGGLSPFTARALEFTVLTASLSTLTNIMEELLKTCCKEMVEFYVGDKWRWSDSFFTLLASLRHNLEMEHLNTLLGSHNSSASKSCVHEILEAYHFHCQSLSSPMRLRWRELCFGEEEQSEAHKGNKEKSFSVHFDVPLLLCDPMSLLLQFFLSWPQNMSQVELKCVIQLIFNLTYVQALIAIGSNLQSQEKESWCNSSQSKLFPPSLTAMASLVWINSTLFATELTSSLPIGITQSVVSEQTIEAKIQEYCSPFLRFSALLSSIWFNHRSLPVDSEFSNFVSYLKLGGNDIDYTKDVTTTDALQWPLNNSQTIITCWCKNLTKKVKGCNEPKSLLPVSCSLWLPPSLISLPKLFDTLFQKYRKKKCKRCQKTPDDPTICLVCGDFLCFHGSCCRVENVNECVQHSINCGSGTGLFLVVSSSVTLIIRDERVCLWGSVYLDSFGEEDRDLRRGKPLYLSEERFARLQEEWRSHVLDKSCKRWGVHLNRL